MSSPNGIEWDWFLTRMLFKTAPANEETVPFAPADDDR